MSGPAPTAETAPVRTRNRRGEGGRLREEILVAAVELIDESGDESTVTLRSVARRVGVAAPSIYRHFPDRQAVVLAVVRLAFAQLHEQLRGALDAAGGEPRTRLFAVCDAYLDYARTHPQRYRTMFGGVGTAALGECPADRAAGGASIRLLADALGACVAAGAATGTDQPADAIALWLGLHGLAHQQAVAREFPWPADIAERIVTALAHLRH